MSRPSRGVSNTLRHGTLVTMSPRRWPNLRERGEKVDIDKPPKPGDGAREPGGDGRRRVLHEAAHKLDLEKEAPKAAKPPPRVFETEGDVVPHAGTAIMVIGALGVVYGDLGTSPLYTEQVVFHSYKATA